MVDLVVLFLVLRSNTEIQLVYKDNKVIPYEKAFIFDNLDHWSNYDYDFFSNVQVLVLFLH